MYATLFIFILASESPHAPIDQRLKSLRLDEQPQAVLALLKDIRSSALSENLPDELHQILILSAQKREVDPLYREIYEVASKKAMEFYPSEPRFLSLQFREAQRALAEKNRELCLNKLTIVKSLNEDAELFKRKLKNQCQLLLFELKKPGDLAADDVALLDAALKGGWYRDLPPRIERKVYARLLDHLAALEDSHKMSEEIVRTPYDRSSKDYAHLVYRRSTIAFRELERSPRTTEMDYYQIFRDSPQTDVGSRSLERSIELSQDETLTSRCREYMDLSIPEARHLRGGSLHRCYLHFSQRYQLEDMQRALVTAEASLSEDYRIRLGLIELALGFVTGEARLKSLQTPKAQQVLAAWKGPSLQERIVLKEWKVLNDKVQEFTKSLIAVLEKGASRYVPRKIKMWEGLDGQLLAFIQQRREGYEVAEALLARARVALKFKEWIYKIPVPQLLTPEEIEAFKGEMNQVNDYWNGVFEARRQECSQRAYTEDEFWVADDLALCPDESLETIAQKKVAEFFKRRAEFEAEWAEQARSLKETEQLKFLEELKKLSDPAAARFWILEGLAVFKNPIDQANAFVELYRRTHNTAYIYETLKIYPYSREALELKSQLLPINGFYKSLWKQTLERWPAQKRRQ